MVKKPESKDEDDYSDDGEFDDEEEEALRQTAQEFQKKLQQLTEMSELKKPTTEGNDDYDDDWPMSTQKTKSSALQQKARQAVQPPAKPVPRKEPAK